MAQLVFGLIPARMEAIVQSAMQISPAARIWHIVTWWDLNFGTEAILGSE